MTNAANYWSKILKVERLDFKFKKYIFYSCLMKKYHSDLDDIKGFRSWFNHFSIFHYINNKYFFSCIWLLCYLFNFKAYWRNNSKYKCRYKKLKQKFLENDLIEPPKNNNNDENSIEIIEKEIDKMYKDIKNFYKIF